jgi:hypothetical protein
VRLGITLPDKLIAHVHRKRDINDLITVNVPDLTFPKSVGCRSKESRPLGNARPSCHRFSDRPMRSIDCHDYDNTKIITNRQYKHKSRRAAVVHGIHALRAVE